MLILLLALFLAFPATAAAAPNVVLIETDDQTVADLESMPRTRALIGDQGVTFTDSFVSLSQCCPSRATLLTGLYAHNHGVLSTYGPFGGADRLRAAETLPVWLQRAGYATIMVGKYLNDYGRGNPFAIPPGWSEWHALLSSSSHRYYDYTINHDGVLRTHAEYQTDVLTQLAESVLRTRAAGRTPFFLWLSYGAPHTGVPVDLVDPPGVRSTVPAPRHRDAFAGVQLPASPARDEVDVTDKPRAIRNRPPADVAAVQETWQQRQESLLAVDEGVARVLSVLRTAGALGRTLVIFTSDNGFMTGQHRVAEGKIVPYEPSIRVPLLMRGPGVPAGVRRAPLVWNGDLAPTIATAAGARAPWPLDGTSLWPVIRGRPLRRDLLLEGPPLADSLDLPRFVGLRTERFVFVKHITTEVELYDLWRDPYQLQNLARDPAAQPLRAELARRLRQLVACRGQACRSG